MFLKARPPHRTSHSLSSVNGPHNRHYDSRPSNGYIKLIAVIPLSLSLLACAKSIEQEVTGRLSSASGAFGNAPLRLYESRLCSGNYSETTTNKDGQFVFHTRTITGTISEFKQELALCQKQNGYWHALWSSVHRAGANPIELICAVQKEGKAGCDPKFNYGT